MALALFDDEKRTGDVLPRLNRLAPSAADAFQACKLGAHEAYRGEPLSLIRAAEQLAEWLAKEAR